MGKNTVFFHYFITSVEIMFPRRGLKVHLILKGIHDTKKLGTPELKCPGPLLFLQRQEQISNTFSFFHFLILPIVLPHRISSLLLFFFGPPLNLLFSAPNHFIFPAIVHYTSHCQLLSIVEDPNIPFLSLQVEIKASSPLPPCTLSHCLINSQN